MLLKEAKEILKKNGFIVEGTEDFGREPVHFDSNIEEDEPKDLAPEVNKELTKINAKDDWTCKIVRHDKTYIGVKCKKNYVMDADDPDKITFAWCVQEGGEPDGDVYLAFYNGKTELAQDYENGIFSVEEFIELVKKTLGEY